MTEVGQLVKTAHRGAGDEIFEKLPTFRHAQNHIFENVQKQPLSMSQEQFLGECAKMYSNAAPPVTTTEWKGPDPMNGHQKSKTVVNCVLKIQGTDETLTIPMWTSATAWDVAQVLGARMGVFPETLLFFRKSGSTYRKLYNHEQMSPKVFVKASNWKMTSFSRQKKVPAEHPFLIIGAGHIGLKTAIHLLHHQKCTNFVCVDRVSIVGGTSWMFQANRTSKLQTEYGVYHLEYDYAAPIPTYFSTPWPSRDDLLKHFHEVSEKSGIMPYIQLNTMVKKMEIVKRSDIKNTWPCLHNEKYIMSLQKTEGDNWENTKGKAWEENFSGICFYPGNLTVPRRDVYKGEEGFKGQIVYGMFGDCNYEECTGADVAIVGHGAFAVENVRTCCEFGCNQIYLLCRRKNISCPRVVSWMVNRSYNPISAANYLDMMQPMYDLMGWDVWDYYAVNANKDRSQANITQKARFGIGDIYFLVGYYGKMEVIVDSGGIKRVTEKEVVMASGRRVEVSCILKLLGFVGLPDNDRLMRLKKMTGFWVDNDPRRYLVAEPVSVMASNFATTSLSPGAIQWAGMGAHFLLFPEEYQPLMESKMMPVHEADDSDPGTYRPGYVVDARFGTQTMMAVPMFCPALLEFFNSLAVLKPLKQRLCHPMRQYLQEAKADWDHYCKMFIQEGWDKKSGKPYPEYPYTYEVTRTMILKHMKESREDVLPSDLEDLSITLQDLK